MQNIMQQRLILLQALTNNLAIKPPYIERKKAVQTTILTSLSLLVVSESTLAESQLSDMLLCINGFADAFNQENEQQTLSSLTRFFEIRAQVLRDSWLDYPHQQSVAGTWCIDAVNAFFPHHPSIFKTLLQTELSHFAGSPRPWLDADFIPSAPVEANSFIRNQDGSIHLIAPLLERACEQLNSGATALNDIWAGADYRSKSGLSDNSLRLLSARSPSFAVLYQLSVERAAIAAANESTSHFKQLIAALKAGGIKGEGDEFAAGASASVGVLAFKGWWDNLSITRKNDFRKLSKGNSRTVGELLDILFNKEQVDTSLKIDYCVNDVADALANILDKKKITRNTLSPVNFGVIDELSSQALVELKQSVALDRSLAPSPLDETNESWLPFVFNLADEQRYLSYQHLEKLPQLLSLTRNDYQGALKKIVTSTLPYTVVSCADGLSTESAALEAVKLLFISPKVLAVPRNVHVASVYLNFLAANAESNLYPHDIKASWLTDCFQLVMSQQAYPLIPPLLSLGLSPNSAVTFFDYRALAMQPGFRLTLKDQDYIVTQREGHELTLHQIGQLEKHDKHYSLNNEADREELALAPNQVSGSLYDLAIVKLSQRPELLRALVDKPKPQWTIDTFSDKDNNIVSVSELRAFLNLAVKRHALLKGSQNYIGFSDDELKRLLSILVKNKAPQLVIQLLKLGLNPNVPIEITTTHIENPLTTGSFIKTYNVITNGYTPANIVAVSPHGIATIKIAEIAEVALEQIVERDLFHAASTDLIRVYPNGNYAYYEQLWRNQHHQQRTDKASISLLTYAFKKNAGDVITELLQHGADPDDYLVSIYAYSRQKESETHHSVTAYIVARADSLIPAVMNAAISRLAISHQSMRLTELVACLKKPGIHCQPFFDEAFRTGFQPLIAALVPTINSFSNILLSKSTSDNLARVIQFVTAVKDAAVWDNVSDRLFEHWLRLALDNHSVSLLKLLMANDLPLNQAQLTSIKTIALSAADGQLLLQLTERPVAFTIHELAKLSDEIFIHCINGLSQSTILCNDDYNYLLMRLMRILQVKPQLIGPHNSFRWLQRLTRLGAKITMAAIEHSDVSERNIADYIQFCKDYISTQGSHKVSINRDCLLHPLLPALQLKNEPQIVSQLPCDEAFHHAITVRKAKILPPARLGYQRFTLLMSTGQTTPVCGIAIEGNILSLKQTRPPYRPYQLDISNAEQRSWLHNINNTPYQWQQEPSESYATLLHYALEHAMPMLALELLVRLKEDELTQALNEHELVTLALSTQNKALLEWLKLNHTTPSSVQLQTAINAAIESQNITALNFISVISDEAKEQAKRTIYLMQLVKRREFSFINSLCSNGYVAQELVKETINTALKQALENKYHGYDDILALFNQGARLEETDSEAYNNLLQHYQQYSQTEGYLPSPNDILIRQILRNHVMHKDTPAATISALYQINHDKDLALLAIESKPEINQAFIQRFKAVYSAIKNTQSLSIFRQRGKEWQKQDRVTLEDILLHANLKPSSITAKALAVCLNNMTSLTPDNTKDAAHLALYQQTYQAAYGYSFFNRTNVSNQSNWQAIENHIFKHQGSRSDIIFNSLGMASE